MIKLNHNLSLDLYYNEEKTIDTKEYDKNSRYITVSLTYKGEEYKISGNSVKARIKWLKPDKKAVFNDCSINSDNTITIDLTEQMLIASGVAKATLSLYDINTDQVLSTTSFNAIVEASAVADDTILSSDEYNSLHDEFKRLNNKVEELDKTVTEHENIREKNEDSRKSNEIKRETNESERINSENARINNENTRIDSENERVKNENTRIVNENVRQHNEATRETQEDKRESDTAIAIEKANEAAKNANDKANDLQTKLDNHHFVLTDELENSVSSTSTTHAPTANAVKITYDKAVSVEDIVNSNKNNWDDKYTKNEIDNKFSTLESNIDWKESVNTFADITKTYPNPEDGWTVNVKDTDYTYRYSGSKWVAISANAIPKATQTLDGLLSKEDKINYDDANNKKHTHTNKSVLDGITSALITAWNNAVQHITDTVKHITPDERNNWNDAYDKANDALPKTGGTLTGSLDIYGNASQNPLRTRGIVGSDGQGKDGDLYLQYGTDGKIYFGKDGSGCIDSDGKAYNGISMSSRYPLGFSSYTPSDIAWGVQTGTPLVAWNTLNGGSIGFRDNCPANGQVSMVIDGRVYQDEGRYPVLDSNNYTSVITKQGICDILGYTPSTGSDSFEIGGTNLFQGTKEFEITNAKSFSNTVSSVTSETYNGLKIRKNLTAWNFYRPIISLEPGNYVFSGYVKGVNGLSTYIQVSAGDTILNAYTFSITSDWKRYSITFEITEKSDVTFYLESREAGEIYECGWKLEKGNKATDWSPAPEDLESALSIRDYNDTSKEIKVGWVGNSLSQDQILSVACYSSGEDDTVKAKIKDVSKDTFKSWLGTVSPSDGSNNYVKVFNSSNVNSSDDLTVNDLADQGFAAAMIAATEDSPIGSGWFHALNFGWGNSKNNWVSQIALGTQPNDGLYYRTTGASIVGKPWKRVLDSSNYANYALKNENLSNVDLNNVTITGIYHLSGTLTNSPLSCNATLLVDFSVGTPYQIFMPDYTWTMYKRIYSNSSWGGWSNFCDGSVYQHGLLDTNFTCVLPNDNTSTFSALNSGGGTTGFFLKSIRGNYNAPSWFEGNYASGIAFGGADTHAVISCRYEFPRVTFCGGNGTEPNWWMRIAGTSDHAYDMDDFVTTSGTTNLAGSIVPNEDVGMELGDETHRFTNVYSSNITTDTIQFNNYDNGGNAIYYSGNDSANGNGGGLNNLVIRSWWGVSFTSFCGAGRYGGKNQTAVGIDCREGVVRAYNFEGLLNGHTVNSDVPSDAKFTDTKGTCLSGRSSSYGWSVNHLPNGYLIEAFHTAAQNYTMTNQYGNMYWARFEITIPQSNNIKFFDAINITPFATSGLISVSITNYTTSKIQGFVFSPLAETKSISFHVTLHGTAS